MAQTEVKPISQDELSQILSGNVESVLTPTDPKKTENTPGFKPIVDTDFSWKELETLDGKKEEEEVITDPAAAVIKTEVVPTDPVKDAEPAKAGRKPTDPVSLVNELVEAGVLFDFEDGPAKTIEDAKELIRLNIEENKKSTSDKFWEDKVKTYSPQVQAILHYAEGGGADVTPLLSAISQVEKTSEFDIESEAGQEAIISEYLKVTGWGEEEIKEELETSKDLNKLKSKAEKFLPKLNQMHEQRIQMIMAEQEERQKEADQARRGYLTTIKNTLDKEKLGDVKLSRQEKAMIWDGLTDVKYTSWSGQPTNLFFKKLEELQAGDKADYDHFLEIAYLTLNRLAFKDKIKTELKNEVTADTVKKLKIQEAKRSNTQEGFFEEEKRPNVVKRSQFKNPWT